MRKIKTLEELDAIASNICQYITVSTYNDGWRIDTKRKATKKERETIYTVIRSALSILNDTKDENMILAVLLMAESTVNRFYPNCNGYNTVYLPLRDIITNW